MNLAERQKEWDKVRNPRLEGDELYCPRSGLPCWFHRCADYDSATNECVHVLAARAQARAADAQTRLAEALGEAIGTDYGSGYKYLRIMGEISKDRDY